MATPDATRPQRAALSNGRLVRHELAFFAGVTAEWMVILGVLVYAFDRSGATATGLASIALLVPYVIVGPLAGSLATRYPPQRVRVAGFVTQFVAYGVAALAAAADLPTGVVAGAAAIGVGATTTMRPTGARVLPGIVRSSRELTVGNLWNGYSENGGALAGPLIGSVLLALGSPALVLLACSALGATSIAISLLPRPIDPPPSTRPAASRGAFATALGAIAELRARPGTLGVMTLAGTQFFAIGALDIIVVVVAEEHLDLGDGGPGWLMTAAGIGALASGLVAARLVGRPRQAVPIIVSMLLVAAAATTLGLALTAVMAFVMLPIVGLGRSLVDILADVLLHRSAPPDMLGAVYSLLEVSSGVGLITGSLVTQVAIAASGPRLALGGIGVFFLLQAALALGYLRRADRSADVPVVSMSMLHGVPLFGPLHQAALEDVARAATEVTVDSGSVVIREGDVGDRFYVVTDGIFDVTIRGRHVGSIERGGSFGEIALLADVPRTASVVARSTASLLAIDRSSFLMAVTGYDVSGRAARDIVLDLDYVLSDDLRSDLEVDGGRPAPGDTG